MTEAVLATVAGGLFAAGLYMMLRRSILRFAIGLATLSNGANLLIFTAGGLTRDRPPLAPAGGGAPPPPVADPLPQALILTAIVISFGVLAFALALVRRFHETVGSDDSDAASMAESLEEGEAPP
ncbi:MAG: NADH-quinone oxidoreductase subunit K [Halobacteria archaeon]